jgi:hypothetical protein
LRECSTTLDLVSPFCRSRRNGVLRSTCGRSSLLAISMDRELGDSARWTPGGLRSSPAGKRDLGGSRERRPLCSATTVGEQRGFQRAVLSKLLLSLGSLRPASMNLTPPFAFLSRTSVASSVAHPRTNPSPVSLRTSAEIGTAAAPLGPSCSETRCCFESTCTAVFTGGTCIPR